MRYSGANQKSLMEKLNEVNSKSFEERTNYIMENLINPKTNIFKMSTDENILNARYYSKNAHAKYGKITGYTLNIPAIENLACLNVNINKYLSEEESKKASDELFNFSHVVKTASGGAHIYCNVNNFDMKGKECYIIAENSKYLFELFAHDNNLIKHANRYVLLYGSKIKYENSNKIYGSKNKYENYGKILEHKLVIGDPKEPVVPSLSYVLECFESTKYAKPKVFFTNHNNTLSVSVNKNIKTVEKKFEIAYYRKIKTKNKSFI